MPSEAAHHIIQTLLAQWGVAAEDRLTARQAAALLGRNAGGMRIWRHHGNGPRWETAENGRVHYRAGDLAEWAASKIPGLERAAKTGQYGSEE